MEPVKLTGRAGLDSKRHAPEAHDLPSRPADRWYAMTGAVSDLSAEFRWMSKELFSLTPSLRSEHP